MAEWSIVTPSEYKKIITKTIESGDYDLPIMAWGSPGIGKTGIIQEVARELETDLVTIHLLLMDQVDMRGIPYLIERDNIKTTGWARPNFLPLNGEGVILYDDIPTATASIQSCAYQLLLEKAIGEHQLGKGWYQTATGNTVADRALTYSMPTPLRNRFSPHLYLKSTAEDWRPWAYLNGIHPSIVGFITEYPQFLFNFDPKKTDHAFATPRTWAKVSKQMNIYNTKTETNLLEKVIAGTVGDEAMVKFKIYLEMHHLLPDFETILRGKLNSFDKIDGPKNSPSFSYGVASGLLNKFTTLAQTKPYKIPPDMMIDNFFEFIMTLPKKEFAVSTCADFIMLYNELTRLQKINVSLLKVNGFSKFADKYGSLLNEALLGIENYKTKGE